MSQASDRLMMRRALALAERGWGRVHPNPLVGAVIERDGIVLGEGWHAMHGGPHAEIEALRAAGDAARGATLHVTLEPCAHHGKTPPCSDAIVAAGLQRVVFAAADPNPAATGGAAFLTAAGIRVDQGWGEARARAQNAAFFCNHEHGRTFLALKLAVSLDARLGETDATPMRVTGRAARAETHRLRAGFDAVMIGIGTALCDDPRLTARGRFLPRVPPTRIVLDRDARLPPQSRLGRALGPGSVWLFCAEHASQDRTAALQRAGVRVFRVGADARGVLLDEVMARAQAEGIDSILCEGGGQVAASLMADDLVDRLYLFIAPAVFGADGPAAFPVRKPLERHAWRPTRLARFRSDALIAFDRLRHGGSN